MPTLESLRRQLDNAEDLQSIVKTMKAIAAVSIRQYEKAVESLKNYNNAVELSFQILFRKQKRLIKRLGAENREKIGAVIFGSEMGMCGQFNEDIATFALGRLEKIDASRENRSIVAIGNQVASIISNEGQTVTNKLAPPNSADMISRSVLDVLTLIEKWRIENGYEHIVLFYNEKESGSSYQPKMMRLIPLDKNYLNRITSEKWPTNNIPQYRLPWGKMLAATVRQYLFVSLFRAFAESLAGENASRLAAMQAAEKNIGERLDELNQQYNHQRQDSITSELLDIVSGYEALESEETSEDENN